MTLPADPCRCRSDVRWTLRRRVRHRSARSWLSDHSQRPAQVPSAPIVERRRLDAESAQVHVTLTAVVNLVVDDVEDEVVQRVFVLAERRDRFLEAFGRDLRPQCIELLRALVPQLEEPMFGPRIAVMRGA